MRVVTGLSWGSRRSQGDAIKFLTDAEIAAREVPQAPVQAQPLTEAQPSSQEPVQAQPRAEPEPQPQEEPQAQTEPQ